MFALLQVVFSFLVFDIRIPNSARLLFLACGLESEDSNTFRSRVGSHCRVVDRSSRITEFQVDWGTGSSNSDICDLRVCSWVGLYLRTLRFWRNSVGSSDKSLSQFEAREDTPHSVKLEGLFFVGRAYWIEVFPWVLIVLPFQLAGEAQDGVDSKDGNEQRFVIRHGNRLATRNQLHGVVMLWWLRCYQRHGMILSCILLPAFDFMIPLFTIVTSICQYVQ